MIFWHSSVLQLIFLLTSPFTSGVCDSAREGRDTHARGPSALQGYLPSCPFPELEMPSFC